MFDENSELIISFFSNGRWAIRVRCLHGEDGASVVELGLSPIQFQKILHLISQEQYMDYDEDFGISFRYPVKPYVCQDGKICFKIDQESEGTKDEIDHD